MSLQFDPQRDGIPALPPADALQGRPSSPSPELSEVPTVREAADGRVLSREQTDRSAPGQPNDPQPGTVVREVRLESGETLSFEWVRELF